MSGITPLRLLTTIAFAAAVAGAAALLGAPTGGWLVAGLGSLAAGLGAMATIPQSTPPPPPPRAPTEDSSPPGPTLDELIDAIDDPCLLVVSRRVVRANPSARALLGEHIVGQDVRLAIRHPAAAERLVGETAPGDPGERSSIELVGIGERDRRWELVIHELSNQSRFVRLIDRSRTHAAEQMRVDFVANASHELRTPLSSLLGYIETLRDDTIDDETRARFIGIMHDQAARMQRLISDLISLSRIEGEKYRPPGETIALAALVEDGSEAACAALGADPARIAIDNRCPDLRILGDRAQLSQLVSNLVGNALKYARPETTVQVRVTPAGAMVRLTVADEGEGIASEHLPRLTERFYRVDPGRSRAMGGTGLGLAIVKHIVERHRGRLNIESEMGHGTSIIIDLPADLDALSSPRNESVT